MWGRVGGDREFPCLPHPTPNTDKSLVPAGPGQEGRTKAGQHLQFQQLRALHLGEQPVVNTGRKQKHRKLGWAGGRVPRASEGGSSKLVILGLIIVLMWRERGPGQRATHALNKYNIFIWHWVS